VFTVIFDPHSDFLMDGARAMQAFSQPWPTAVIGWPTSINFNVSKSEFRLTVLVHPEDVPRPRDDISSSSTGLDKEDKLAMEIYVPLIHHVHEVLSCKVAINKIGCSNRYSFVLGSSLTNPNIYLVLTVLLLLMAPHRILDLLWPPPLTASLLVHLFQLPVQQYKFNPLAMLVDLLPVVFHSPRSRST
jgi:hypothetical protein